MAQTGSIAVVLSFLLGACVGGGDASSGPQVTGTSAPRCETTSGRTNAEAASATNAIRGANGLNALRADPRLAQAAARQACDMAKRGRMTHRGATSGPMQRVKAQGYAPRIVAENIAAGPFTMQSALQVWSGSRGHAANILNPQMRDFGIGRAVGADGKTVFWSAVYAAPR
ncbi:CAP domain-containing protein [Paracoccus sp. MBLB3053]|uniref:CAP domain-containing protein n=1 Tax=Paracoccus aurantius TaxID=3073814 RepID=A0ABU2HMK2_9RHOB|nr:CAP domain-containing protein [Paracoccus sp. MBLB3053]MDS9466251.1 CAP domain-containing protein [Paracoccus sp. MBLB3053]